jgi:hypothetical protein
LTVDPQRLRLLHDQQAVLQVPQPEQDVRVARFDAGEHRAEVGRAHRVLLEGHDGEAVMVRPVAGHVGGFQREEVVRGEDGHRLGRRRQRDGRL